jgi:hypothetical protein
VLTPTEDESADVETTLDVNGMSPDYAAKDIALWANVATVRTFRSPSAIAPPVPKNSRFASPLFAVQWSDVCGKPSPNHDRSTNRCFAPPERACRLSVYLGAFYVLDPVSP